ncbi:MAG: ice-binding family protein [Pseudomonadota bacterium]
MAMFFALLMSACSNDDTNGSSVGGTASKGPISGGTITAYRIDAGARGTALASTTTDANGNYSLNIRTYTGPLLLEVTGGTYRDEATGVSNTPLATPLRAAFSYGGGNVTASVTLLTEVAVINAMADPGGLTAANIQTENNTIKTQVGFDPVTTRPADPMNAASATASPASRVYGAYLAGASQYMTTNPGTTLSQTASVYATALQGSTFASDPAILTAQSTFLANTTNNKTGITDVTALQALSTTLGATISTASSKAITSFTLAGQPATIDQTTRTINVTVPSGTSLTQAPTFTNTGASIAVNGTAQVSGTTTNDFSNPVTYTVTDANGATTTYTVNVTVAPTSARTITAFSINGVAGTINQTDRVIAVPLPAGTDRTALAPTFTTLGASVMVGTTPQVSGTTANNFTSPVTYTVTAANGATADYTVTVAPPAGPTALLLGSAAGFAIFAESGVSASGTSAITGDVGVGSAASSVTGLGIPTSGIGELAGASSVQVTGSVYTSDMNSTTATNLTAAMTAALAAYTDASGRTSPTSTDLLGGNVGGETGGHTFTPGLYKWNTMLTIPASGTITLNGGPNDVWIFQVSGNLVADTGSNVVLTGGALAKNVYWQVNGTVTLANNAHFVGTILSTSSITLQSGSVLNGRAISQGTVSLNSATVTRPAP